MHGVNFMIVQLPRQPGSADSAKQKDGDCSAFEAAVRKDIASAQLISYGSAVGGWQKRLVDALIAAATSPVWGIATLVFALGAKARYREHTVLQSEVRIGYGGRAFRAWRLRLTPSPAANVVLLHPAIAAAWDAAEDRRVAAAAPSWRTMIEHAPRMLNVLCGDMSLVGPSPLSVEQVEKLRSSKRFYFSLRPGLVMASLEEDGKVRGSAHYKPYAMNWTLESDFQILWKVTRNLRDQDFFLTSSRRRIKFAD